MRSLEEHTCALSFVSVLPMTRGEEVECWSSDGWPPITTLLSSSSVPGTQCSVFSEVVCEPRISLSLTEIKSKSAHTVCPIVTSFILFKLMNIWIEVDITGIINSSFGCCWKWLHLIKQSVGKMWIRLSWRMRLFAGGDSRLFEYIIDTVSSQIVVMITPSSWNCSNAIIL